MFDENKNHLTIGDYLVYGISICIILFYILLGTAAIVADIHWGWKLFWIGIDTAVLGLILIGALIYQTKNIEEDSRSQ